MFAFFDYFCREKFPNIPVSLVSELHNHNYTRSALSNQIVISPLRTHLRRFSPCVIGRFLWNSIPQLIRDKPSKKLFRKLTLLRLYLAQYLWNIISLTIYSLSYFIFFLYFVIKNYKVFVVRNFEEHNISFFWRAALLSFLSTMRFNWSAVILSCALSLFVNFICHLLFHRTCISNLVLSFA